MGNLGRFSCGALVSLLSASVLVASQDKKAIPADFKLVAKYDAGYSQWKSWRSTITRDGRVRKEVLGDKRTTEEAKLSQDDLSALLAAVEAADFHALKETYEYDILDNPTLSLTVTLHGKTHDVSVYAPRFQRNGKEVRRFLDVWSEVLRKVPAPNPEQTPDQYKP